MSQIAKVLERNGIKPTAKADDPGKGDTGADGGTGAGTGGDTDDPNKGAGAGTPAAAPENTGGTGAGTGGDTDDPNKGAGAGTPAVAPENTGDDIDDEKLMAALQKRGFKGKSIDELTKPAAVVLTPEQEAQQLQERQDSMRQFALKNKIVTSTEFDNYVKETNLPKTDLAFLLYRKERLEALQGTPADQLPTDEELRNEFDETHHLYADENDPKRQRAEKLLNKVVDDYIDDKYSSIVNLEETFTAHQTEKEQRSVYNNVVKEVLASFGPTLEFKVNDGKKEIPVKFNISPQLISTLEKQYMADLSFHSLGQGNVSRELLQQAMRGNIIASEFEQILTEAAVTYHAAMFEETAKGRRGILPLRESGSDGGEKRENKVIKGILQRPENQKLIKNP